MGLSGRKVKQRIPQDPRNLSWADGMFKYLSPCNSLTPMFFKMQQGLDPITSQNLDGTRRKVSVQVVMVEYPISKSTTSSICSA